jgi:iron complex transport system substrate-binding protein
MLLAAAAALLAVGVPSATSAPSPGAAFPVTIRTAAGPVTVKARPTRVVSLSPTATETLFAIGAGPQVIAVDERSDHPREAPRTSLSGFTPNAEAIAARKPDLVVVALAPRGLADALGKLGIPVVVHGAATTFKGAYQQIRQLGLVTGNARAAARLVERMQRRIAKVVSAVRVRAEGKRVYHELDPFLYSATSRTFIGKVYALFGLENVADAADGAGTGYPQLSAEYLLAANPDVIVLADTVCCGQSARTLAERPGWERLSALRTGSVVRLDDSIASRWGPRIVNFVRAVGAALARLSR